MTILLCILALNIIAIPFAIANKVKVDREFQHPQEDISSTEFNQW